MFWMLRFAIAVCLFIAMQPALAAVSPEEAKRLESDLTPMGAERAGNAAGTIPAWDGGLTEPPPGIGYEPGKFHKDPYANDKPLFTVNAANMANYESQLTETHKELLKAYPDSYFLNVYPTHRSCAYPKFVYDAAARNAVSGKMVDDDNGIARATMAIPFPIPQSGREVLWNHELRYQGHLVTRESAATTPTKGGDYTIESSLEQWIYNYTRPGLAKPEDMNNIQQYFMRRGVAPASNAGTIQVMHNTMDQVLEKRRGWFYRPGERKVKPVIGAEYDNVIPSSEGIRFNDSFNVFNGGGDRYDWELIGKQEKFIPYNTFLLASPETKYTDILHKSHLNPAPIRYELHRVWVIEAKLKPGKQHNFAARRLMYTDEDSSAGVAAAMYDASGKLSRVQEAHLFDYYEVPLCNIGSDVVYDLSGGRYHIVGMRNEQNPVRFSIQDDPESFSAEGVRRLGVR